MMVTMIVATEIVGWGLDKKDLSDHPMFWVVYNTNIWLNLVDFSIVSIALVYASCKVFGTLKSGFDTASLRVERRRLYLIIIILPLIALSWIAYRMYI